MKKKTELKYLLNEMKIKWVEIANLTGQMKIAKTSGLLGMLVGSGGTDVLRWQQLNASISQLSAELRKLRFQVNELREEVEEEVFVEVVREIFKEGIEKNGEQKVLDAICGTDEQA